MSTLRWLIFNHHHLHVRMQALTFPKITDRQSYVSLCPGSHGRHLCLVSSILDKISMNGNHIVFFPTGTAEIS